MDWNKLDLTIKFRESGIAGSLPASELGDRYAKLISVGASNEIKMALQEQGIASQEDVEAYLKNCTSVFSVDEEGFYLRPVQFIGMLCMAAARTKLSIERRGMKSTLIQGTTIIDPIKLYLLRGKLGKDSRAIAPKTTGRSAIKRTQVLTNTEPLSFQVRWLDNGDISFEDMETLFTVGQEIGIGGDRRFGYGKFDILKMERLNGAKPARSKSKKEVTK